MSILNGPSKKISCFLIGIVFLGFLSSCGFYKPGDRARKISPNVNEEFKFLNAVFSLNKFVVA